MTNGYQRALERFEQAVREHERSGHCQAAEEKYEAAKTGLENKFKYRKLAAETRDVDEMAKLRARVGEQAVRILHCENALRNAAVVMELAAVDFNTGALDAVIKLVLDTLKGS
jgi:hypothetical protein